MHSWLLSLLTLASDGGAEVVLELAYEPKFCVTTPCPQFRILSAIKGEMPRQVAADLVNLDPAKSALSAFRHVRVTGSVAEVEGVTQIKVSQWEVVVRETVKEQGN
jgi:hypothetical protein